MDTRKIHYVSGLIISLFVVLHLYNHLCSLSGAERHIEVMNSLRPFYRNVFSETVLLSAVLIQIVSGIRLFKTVRGAAVTRFEKLHIWSGLYLALFLIIHLGAVLGGRYVLHLDTNFYFGAAGLNTFPFYLFFVPYYSLAILSFFAHIASVHHKKMTTSILGIRPAQQSVLILVTGCILAALILYGLTDKFNGVTIPGEYGILIGK